MSSIRTGAASAALVGVMVVAGVMLSGCTAVSPILATSGASSAWAAPRSLTVSAASPSGATETARPASRTTSRRTADPDTIPAVPAAHTSGDASDAHAATVRHGLIADRFSEAGKDWLGVPYLYGGETRRGIDCSAFTQRLYREAFNWDLTRTTATQVNEGRFIRKDQLIPGDLVFFRRRGTRHVGVYLGEGDFIHASSSRGVMISNLSETYWTRYYWTARRILPPTTLSEEALTRAESLRRESNRSPLPELGDNTPAPPERTTPAQRQTETSPRSRSSRRDSTRRVVW